MAQESIATGLVANPLKVLICNFLRTWLLPNALTCTKKRESCYHTLWIVSATFAIRCFSIMHKSASNSPPTCNLYDGQFGGSLISS